MPVLPADAPKSGEVYQHYKGDRYEVVGLALDSSDQWVVVYKPLYENSAAPLFTRPCNEWNQRVDLPASKGGSGEKVERFTKVE